MERDYYDFHKDMQFRHWWFVGRRKIVEAFLGRNGGQRGGQILDIGSGYGSLIPTLRRFGDVDVIERLGDSHGRLRDLGARQIYDLDFPSHCPPQRYDLVTLFDVLEHIEDDYQALRTIRKNLLSPQGKCILTVPACMWLWSKHDELNHHCRRYSGDGLIDLLRRAGYNHIRSSYFMSLLFPLAVVDRLSSGFRRSPQAHISPPRPRLNALLGSIFGLESWAISRFRLPFGLSLIAEGQG